MVENIVRVLVVYRYLLFDSHVCAPLRVIVMMIVLRKIELSLHCFRLKAQCHCRVRNLPEAQ